jgi:hypothetical protein
MSKLQIDRGLLRQFERQLDPRHPENGSIPARVIGFGEISTVLEIGAGDGGNLAYKRVPLFRTEAEAEHYEALYREYIQLLQDRVGIRVVPGDITRLVDEEHERVVVYIVQEKLPQESIGNKAIHHLPAAEVERLILAILGELSKVFRFNQQHKNRLELAIDGQISNWAILHFYPEQGKLDESIDLVYIDTSTPLLCKDSREQLDPELFLRSAPSFLVWILRWLFLKDVMTRYYDFRKVSLDIVANMYKEQRAALVPGLVKIVNGFFSTQMEAGEFKPLIVKEVQAYYQEDAWIWRLYLAFRKIDRSLHSWVGKHYPYILPEKIKR